MTTRSNRSSRISTKSSGPPPAAKNLTVLVPRRNLPPANSALPSQPGAIPVHPSPRHAGHNSLEIQADRMADSVMSHSRQNASSGPTASTPSLRPQSDRPIDRASAPPAVREALGSEGRPLDPDTRSFMESRFGQEFSRVRVHTGSRAAESAQSLGAHAYAAGNHLVFGDRAYNPSALAGRHLIAHELAHVVQQGSSPRTPAQIQRKLIAAGDAAGFAAFANSVIAVQFQVVVAPSGEVSIQSTNVQGPPTREAQELVKALKTSIDDPKVINMEFIHGATSARPDDASVLGGNYALARVDLDDLSALGTQEAGVSEGRTGGSILVHEVTEQFRKQVHGEAFAAAHAVATGAEEAAIGATRGAEKYNQVNPTTLEVTIPYTYPDGHIVEVTWDIVKGNYGNVRRKVIPPPAAAHHP